jgi:transcriptional regulator with XRE-family HTH domain
MSRKKTNQNNLFLWRKDKNDISLREFCEKINISVNLLQRFESGEGEPPNIGLKIKMAEALSCTVFDLFPEDAEMDAISMRKIGYTYPEDNSSEKTSLQLTNSIKNGIIDNIKPTKNRNMIPMIDSKGNIMEASSVISQEYPIESFCLVLGLPKNSQPEISQNYFTMIIPDDSMDGGGKIKVPHKALVYFDKSECLLSSMKSRYAVHCASGVLLREISVNEKGTYDVIAYNTTYTSHRDMTKEQILVAFGGKFEILGKAVRILSDEV